MFWIFRRLDYFRRTEVFLKTCNNICRLRLGLEWHCRGHRDWLGRCWRGCFSVLDNPEFMNVTFWEAIHSDPMVLAERNRLGGDSEFSVAYSAYHRRNLPK